VPKGQVRAVATPGGTGSIRNTVANYSCPGDQVLTTDWHWGPYNTIAQELGRKLSTFQLFDENRKFNIADFSSRVKEILGTQDRLVVIINTPAQNPTGYSLTMEDWQGVSDFLADLPPEKRIALLVDTAYIDFAGDEDEYREFLPILETLPPNVLPIIAFSMSKTFTLYGLRCGAMICLAPDAEIADEFLRVCEFSSRGTWSNSPKAGQSIITNIFADADLLKKVTDERAEIRNLLLERGHAFEEEAAKVGLEILPYDAGFFITIPCDDPTGVSSKLEKEGIFLVPLGKGLRVSVASISADKCRMIPSRILAAMGK
jgi:aromatic-amino-acid transaminase